MGYRRILTYILDTEPGTTLRAAGWKLMAHVGYAGKTWDTPSRRRTQRSPTNIKQRWQAGDDPPYPPAPIWPELERSPQLALELLTEL